jgi:uncharacterized Zn finger protein (UPF0148 family)
MSEEVKEGARKVRPKKPKREHLCPVCKIPFFTNRDAQVFCSSLCRWKKWNEKYPRSGERAEDIQKMRAWLEGLEFDNPAFTMVKSVVCTRIAKRKRTAKGGKKL